MRQLQVHWRPRHITTSASERLAEVLAAHPGPDEVIVVAYDKRVRLGVTVDSTARGLRHAAALATGACVIEVDTEDAF